MNDWVAYQVVYPIISTLCALGGVIIGARIMIAFYEWRDTNGR